MSGVVDFPCHSTAVVYTPYWYPPLSNLLKPLFESPVHCAPLWKLDGSASAVGTVVPGINNADMTTAVAATRCATRTCHLLI